MAALSISTIDRDGVAVSALSSSAEVGGDTIANTGREFLYFDNQDISATTITFDITKTVDDQAVTDRTLLIGAGAQVLVGPFPTEIYGSTLALSYSSVTSLAVAAVKLTT